MAKRWLCIRVCTFKGRLWDPNSRLEKDRIYVGPEAPAKNFVELKAGESAPSMESDKPKAAALSEIQKKGLDLVLS